MQRLRSQVQRIIAGAAILGGLGIALQCVGTCTVNPVALAGVQGTLTTI